MTTARRRAYQDHAVCVREAAQGSPDFFDRNAEPLGDLARNSECAPGSPAAAPHIDSGPLSRCRQSLFFSSLTPQRRRRRLDRLDSSAVVRISCA